MKNDLIQEILDRITPEQHAEFERQIEEDIAFHEQLKKDGKIYATDTSITLDIVRAEGFNPIGITSFMCDELIIFSTKTEAEKAYKSLEVKRGLISCYFYSKNQFQKEVSDDKYFNSKIYWLTDKQKPTWKARVGEKHTTKEGCEFELIVCNNQKECTIKFLEPPFTVLNNISYVAILGGGIKNPNHPSVYGVGYFGIGKYKSQENGKKTRCYTAWINMLKRCYNKKVHEKQPTYKDVVVCEEWHNFQNFAKWHEENWKPWMDENWQLDKDILVKGNKIYSPNTCCFIPVELNKLFNLANSIRGNYPIGVTFEKNKYVAKISKNNYTEYLGRYSTVEEAFEVYKKAKELHIKELADKWRDKINPQIYKTLINYKVEITI